MPIDTARGAQMRNRTVPTAKQKRDMRDALDLVQYADLWRTGQNISSYNSVRVDNQGVWSAGHGQNIQSQLNQPGKATSIAGVLLADSLGDAQGALNQTAVVLAVRQAMISSAEDGYFYQVTGTSPDPLSVPEQTTPDQAAKAPETASG